MALLSRLALGAALLAATLAAATIAMEATATLAVPTKLAVPAHLAAPAKLPRDASSASKGIGPPPGGCRAMARSTDVFHFCVRGGGPSSLCCRALLEAAGSGGLPCVCEIANTPFMVTSGYTAADLLAAYTTCGGQIQVESRLATKCGAGSFLLDSGPPLPDSVQTDESARDTDSEEDDSDEENVISPPPPRRSHQHHRKGHQTLQTQEVDMEAEDGVMPEVHVRHHQESLLDKLERGAQVVGAILPPVTILVLVIYILCAGPGHRVDRAKSMFKALVPILPVLVEQWMVNKTASTTTTAAAAPNPSVSVEGDAGIAMGIVANPDLAIKTSP